MKLEGLYLILDQAWATSCSLPEVMGQAGEVGVQIVQYRDKHSPMREAYQIARTLRDLARRWNMVFVVNDRCDLALAVDADGVHLGQQDIPIPMARKIMGKRKLIGVSTHTAPQVRRATEQGANYLGFGPVFPTTTKQRADPVVGVEGVREIRTLTSLPIFAIGGIGPRHVQDLCQAGADGVAVASAVLNAENPQKMLMTFQESFPEEI